MSGSEQARATVELQHAADTITGSVSVGGAPAGDFYGWLELIALLDRAAGGRITGTEDEEAGCEWTASGRLVTHSPRRSRFRGAAGGRHGVQVVQLIGGASRLGSPHVWSPT